MMIIQTKPPELIEPSHKKWRCVFLSVICIIVSIIFIIVVFGPKKKYSSHIYNNSSEILKKFNNSPEDFYKLVELFNNHKLFEIMFEDNGNHSIFDPYSMRNNTVLSKSEYEYLVYFFETYKPHVISDKWDYFLIEILEKETGALSFFYIDTEDAESTLLYLSQDYDLIQLSPNWYYG